MSDKPQVTSVKCTDTLRLVILALLDRLITSTPPYNQESFTRHIHTNRTMVENGDKVPARILHWLRSSCNACGIKYPPGMPCTVMHLDKGNRVYLIVTPTEQAKLRAEYSGRRVLHVTNHAKLAYLERVMGLDLIELLKDFPHEELLTGEGLPLVGERTLHSVGTHNYIVSGNNCVTVLTEDMPAI